MNTFNSLKKLIVGSFVATLVAAAAIVTVLAAPADIASADNRPPGGPRPGPSEIISGTRPARPISGTNPLTGTVRLEAAFKVISQRVANYDEHIERANAQVTKVNEFVTTQKAAGKDTSAVETALAAFSAAIPQAEAKFESAETLVNSHAGFDASGKVTDETQAKATLQSIQTAMREGDEILRKAQAELMKAMREFRRNNPSTP